MTHPKGAWPKRALKRSRNLLDRISGTPRRWYASRAHMLRHLPRHARGAELGVYRGEFMRHLLEATRPRELHLVDGWSPLFGETFPDWGEYTDFGRMKTREAFDAVEQTVAPFRPTVDLHLHAGDDVAYLEQQPDAALDWAYIDSSHQYDHTLEELTVLDRKVAARGWILGHDWWPDPAHRHHGVCRAVREFCDRSNWRITILDNHHQWAIRRDVPRTDSW